MPLRVVRKQKETSQNLVRRFSRSVRQSGILLEARKSLFRERPLSERAKKLKALRREELRKKYEELKKLGRIP